jgi:murein L,D-transpeptidase YcbB/YkuD
VKQAPGADNALGTVKFLFPNDYNVYLHGTPASGLFSKSRSDFSHGCIRENLKQGETDGFSLSLMAKKVNSEDESCNGQRKQYELEPSRHGVLV